VRGFLQTWRDAFHEHRLLTYATAMAMRAFIASIALAFLGLAVMGGAGDKSVWKDHVAPAIEPKLTQPTFDAINAAVEKIFASNSAGLIAFAAAYAVWQMSGAIRAVMDALNAIIERDEKRSTQGRFLISVALAVAVTVLIGCALFVVLFSGKLLGASGGLLHWLIAFLRWPAAAVFLGLAVGLVARFAPVEHRGARWASVGATLIVVAWLVESAIYAWFLENHMDYKSATGNLLLLVVVVTYFYVSSVVFLIGAQLDEFLRQDAKGHETVGVHELARRVF
jgi:membrane protein